MIDKKKILQRLNKGSKLKEYPLLNLYILVAAFFQILGELADLWLLRSLRPLPILLMVLYIHGKNSSRKHLVPSLVQAALVVFLLVDLVLAVGDEPSMVVLTAVRIVGHLVMWVSLSFGEWVRELGEFQVVRELVNWRWVRRLLNQRSFRKLAYLVILGTTAGVLYLIA